MVGMHVPNADGTVSSHTVCELFINVLDKWVVFDPYSKATYYMRDDLPLSALELRELMFKNLYRDITTVVSVGDFTEVVSVREKLLPLYRYLYIWRMNDIIGKSAGKESISWAELFQTHLVWEDEYSLVSEGNFDKEIRFAGGGREDSTLPGVRYVTHNVSDFYWKINQVLLHFDRIEDEKLRVFMDSMTPNFSHFIIRIEGGERTEVMKKTTNVFDVDQIMVNLTVSGVNTLGVPGQLTEINIAIP